MQVTTTVIFVFLPFAFSASFLQVWNTVVNIRYPILLPYHCKNFPERTSLFVACFDLPLDSEAIARCYQALACINHPIKNLGGAKVSVERNFTSKVCHGPAKIFHWGKACRHPTFLKFNSWWSTGGDALIHIPPPQETSKSSFSSTDALV